MEIICPVTKSYHSSDEVLAEIKPLVEFLKNGDSAEQEQTFPRGTVTSDLRLDLCKQNIGIEGCALIADSLRENKTIKSLLLGTDGIGDAGAEKIAELIKHNQTLETIYLGCNDIRAKGAEALAAAIEENQSVKGLWLKRNPIGTGGAQKLAQILKKNTALKVLDLVNTDLKPEGIAEILDTLINHNRSIERLYLGGNKIAAAEDFKKLLASNNALKSLMLNVNSLGDGGAFEIAEGLKLNRNLEELGLASNNIGLTGAKALLESLNSHPNLRNLDLGYAPSTRVLGAERNDLGDEFAIYLRDFLSANPPLHLLNLSKTGITQKGFAIIEEGLRQNTNLCGLKINGKLSESAKEKLQENSRRINYQSAPEIKAIKSVYRTARNSAKSVSAMIFEDFG